nr:hypothetical protein [Marseillevirus cajuinensis]
MEKFLETKEVVSFAVASGEEKIEKSRFTKKIVKNGEFSYRLPDGTLHGVEISRTRLEVMRSVFDNGTEVSCRVYVPSQDFSFSYPLREWFGVTFVERDETGKTTLHVSKGMEISRETVNGKLLKKGSIKEIICRNFLASFDL